VRDSSGTWHGRADLDARSASGTAIPGATVVVVVRSWTSTGGGGDQLTEKTVTVVADEQGQVVVNTGSLPRSGKNRANSVTLSIQDVQSPEGSTWDGTTSEVAIDRS
jgi:hypothetical protein